MPIRVHFVDDLLMIDFSGEVTTQDFGTMLAEVVSLEQKLHRTPDRLADFTATTGLNLNYHDIERAVQARRISPPANPIRSAVVGPRPVQYGMARMFQALNDSPHVTVEVFRDRASALAWLGQPALP